MLSKLRLLVINVRRRTVLLIVCKYILFFNVKVVPTVRERWPKTKQSENQLLASSSLYAKCSYHSLLLYQTHLITSPQPTPTSCVLSQRQFVKLKLLQSQQFLNHLLSLPLGSGVAPLSEHRSTSCVPTRATNFFFFFKQCSYQCVCWRVCSSLCSAL